MKREEILAGALVELCDAILSVWGDSTRMVVRCTDSLGCPCGRHRITRLRYRLDRPSVLILPPWAMRLKNEIMKRKRAKAKRKGSSKR